MAGLLRKTSSLLAKLSQNARAAPASRGMSVLNMDDDGSADHGRTTMTDLKDDGSGALFVDAYSKLGFRLTNGLRISGPCVVFPKSFFSWNVASVQGITEEALSLFTVLEPKLDVLVLGCGLQEDTTKLDPKIISFLREKKINIEILSTDAALATFNFLNSEQRFVAGAFIPPAFMPVTDADYDFTTSRLNKEHNEDWLLKEAADRPDDVHIEPLASAVSKWKGDDMHFAPAMTGDAIKARLDKLKSRRAASGQGEDERIREYKGVGKKSQQYDS